MYVYRLVMLMSVVDTTQLKQVIDLHVTTLEVILTKDSSCRKRGIDCLSNYMNEDVVVKFK